MSPLVAAIETEFVCSTVYSVSNLLVLLNDGILRKGIPQSLLMVSSSQSHCKKGQDTAG